MGTGHQILKKIQEFILTTRETRRKDFETITISNMPNLPDSYKKWLLNKKGHQFQNDILAVVSAIFQVLPH